MSRTRLEWAQWMAEKGIKAFIIEANSKRPLGGNSWMLRNSFDPQQLAEWFEMTPNCNYGLHLGASYVVIDLDWKPNANGIEEFEEICRANGVENFLLEFETLMVKTPSGGYHIYFKTPHPCANKNHFPNGIDVRGAVGYVVGPGSKNTQGTWKIVDESMPIMDIPEFLLDYLVLPGVKDPHHEVPLVDLDQPEDIELAKNWLKDTSPAIEGENGDNHTYDVCCMMRDFGISEEMTLRLLNETGWNARCEPPWDDNELEVKISNSYAFGQNRPGVKSLTYEKAKLMVGRPEGGWASQITDAQVVALFHPDTSLRTMMEQERGTDEDPEIPTDVEDEDDDVLEKFRESGQLWYGIEEFAAINRVREYIVKDWLIAHGITALLARRGTGKSTIALDLACHLATDREWWGLPTMKDWCVIYICGEDDEGMILNVRAWAQHHEEMPSSDRFLVARGIIKMTNKQELSERLREMVDWARGRRCVVILDTWARAVSGYSSNAQEEMDLAYENAETVAEALEGPMLACFHPPKDKRMTIRGSAVQEDASSGIWNLEKETNGVKLTIQRAKGKGEGNYRMFRFEKVDLPGKDFYKEPLQGLVPIKISGTEDENTEDHVKRQADERYAWAKAVIGALAVFPTEHPDIEGPNPNTTSISKWIIRMWSKQDTDDPIAPLAKRFVKEHMDKLIELKQLENVTLNDFQGIRRQLENRFMTLSDPLPVTVNDLVLRIKIKPNTQDQKMIVVEAKEESDEEVPDTLD